MQKSVTDEKKIPGIVLGVANVEREIYFQGGGYHRFNDSSSGEISPNSVFWICSQTKMIAAVSGSCHYFRVHGSQIHAVACRPQIDWPGKTRFRYTCRRLSSRIQESYNCRQNFNTEDDLPPSKYCRHSQASTKFLEWTVLSGCTREPVWARARIYI